MLCSLRKEILVLSYFFLCLISFFWFECAVQSLACLWWQYAYLTCSMYCFPISTRQRGIEHSSNTCYTIKFWESAEFLSEILSNRKESLPLIFSYPDTWGDRIAKRNYLYCCQSPFLYAPSLEFLCRSLHDVLCRSLHDVLCRSLHDVLCRSLHDVLCRSLHDVNKLSRYTSEYPQVL